MTIAAKIPPIAIKGQHRGDTELEAWICARPGHEDCEPNGNYGSEQRMLMLLAGLTMPERAR